MYFFSRLIFASIGLASIVNINAANPDACEPTDEQQLELFGKTLIGAADLPPGCSLFTFDDNASEESSEACEKAQLEVALKACKVTDGVGVKSINGKFSGSCSDIVNDVFYQEEGDAKVCLPDVCTEDDYEAFLSEVLPTGCNSTLDSYSTEVSRSVGSILLGSSALLIAGALI